MVPSLINNRYKWFIKLLYIIKENNKYNAEFHNAYPSAAKKGMSFLKIDNRKGEPFKENLLF